MKLSSDTGPVCVAKDRIDSRFRAIEQRHHQHLSQLQLHAEPEAADGSASVHLGDSTALSLDDDSVDVCITSPPYCTRIDYAVLTRPELAVLGISADKPMRALREGSIGSPTMAKVAVVADEEWGAYTNDLLMKITGHKSKASKSYYSRYFHQYFDGMYRSLSELRRVLKPDAVCALVVQDSYYKEIHVDLARALSEMGSHLGWSSSDRVDYPVPHRRANMNPATAKYRTGALATESLLMLST